MGWYREEAGHKPRIAQFLHWFRTRPSKLAKLTPKMLRRHYKMAMNLTPEAIEFLGQSMGSTPEEESEQSCGASGRFGIKGSLN